MLIQVPDWVVKAREKLDKFVDDLIRDNNVDWVVSHDSISLDDAKQQITDTLWRIHENVGLEERKRLEEFEKSLKKEGSHK